VREWYFNNQVEGLLKILLFKTKRKRKNRRNKRKKASQNEFLRKHLGRKTKVTTEFTFDSWDCRSLNERFLIGCLGRESKAELPFETADDACLSFPTLLFFTKLALTPLELPTFAFLFLTGPFCALDCSVGTFIFASFS